MRDRKFGLKALGLALMAALGLMAFMAVAAQAETLPDGGKTGKFLVQGEAALAKTGVTFSTTQIGTGTLLVPTRVDILCKKGTVTGEFKTTEPIGLEALGSAEFTECTAWQPVALGATHTTSAKCTVKEPIIVEKARALPKLHEGEPYVELEEDGAVFTTVFLEGPECILTKKNEITGATHALVEGSGTAEPKLILSEEIAKLFQPSTTTGTHLKFGGLDAYIDATAQAKLTDAEHLTKTLGVC